MPTAAESWEQLRFPIAPVGLHHAHPMHIRYQRGRFLHWSDRSLPGVHPQFEDGQGWGRPTAGGILRDSGRAVERRNGSGLWLRSGEEIEDSEGFLRPLEMGRLPPP